MDEEDHGLGDTLERLLAIELLAIAIMEQLGPVARAAIGERVKHLPLPQAVQARAGDRPRIAAAARDYATGLATRP